MSENITAPITVGRLRELIATLPDDAPIVVDTLEGPNPYCVNLHSFSTGIPEHWAGCANADELPQGLWIHTTIVDWDTDDEEWSEGPDEEE